MEMPLRENSKEEMIKITAVYTEMEKSGTAKLAPADFRWCVTDSCLCTYREEGEARIAGVLDDRSALSKFEEMLVLQVTKMLQYLHKTIKTKFRSKNRKRKFHLQIMRYLLI